MNKITSAVILFLLSFACIAMAAQEQSVEKRDLTSGDIKRETGEAVDTTGAFIQQKKELYQKKTEDTLHRFESKVKNLYDRAGRSGERAKARISGAAERLKQKNDEAKDKLRDMKAAGDEKWNKLKNELDSMMLDIEQSYKRTISRFSSKEKNQQNKEE